MLRTIFFDLDGTLTHPHEGITRSIQHAHRVNGLEPPTGAPASSVVMVGDRGEDVLGAKANGACTVAVSWGYGSPEELEAAGPDITVTSTAKLQALQALFGTCSLTFQRSLRGRGIGGHLLAGLQRRLESMTGSASSSTQEYSVPILTVSMNPSAFERRTLHFFGPPLVTNSAGAATQG